MGTPMTGADSCVLLQCKGVIGAPIQHFYPLFSPRHLPLSAPARSPARHAHCRCCHLHSASIAVYFTTPRQRRTQESRVILMGQMYSDEDKRSLFSFPSKAGNGKSVPRRNHVLPGVEGLCRVAGSCQALIRDSFLHLRVCVHTVPFMYYCVSVSLHVLETVRAFAHYKVTCRMGLLQCAMLMACWETGRRKAISSHSSHNTGIISSVCVVLASLFQQPVCINVMRRAIFFCFSI